MNEKLVGLKEKKSWLGNGEKFGVGKEKTLIGLLEVRGRSSGRIDPAQLLMYFRMPVGQKGLLRVSNQL